MILEYSAEHEGKPIRFYMKGLLKDKKLLTATGAALESQWPEAGARIKATVDSFKLKK